MSLRVEVYRDDDDRWIGEVPDLPGSFVYGATRREAFDRVRALALRVIADRLERGATVPDLAELFGTTHAPLTWNERPPAGDPAQSSK